MDPFKLLKLHGYDNLHRPTIEKQPDLGGSYNAPRAVDQTEGGLRLWLSNIYSGTITSISSRKHILKRKKEREKNVIDCRARKTDSKTLADMIW